MPRLTVKETAVDREVRLDMKEPWRNAKALLSDEYFSVRGGVPVNCHVGTRVIQNLVACPEVPRDELYQPNPHRAATYGRPRTTPIGR